MSHCKSRMASSAFAIPFKNGTYTSPLSDLADATKIVRIRGYSPTTGTVAPIATVDVPTDFTAGNRSAWMPCPAAFFLYE